MRSGWRPRETKGQAILGREIRGAREEQRGLSRRHHYKRLSCYLRASWGPHMDSYIERMFRLFLTAFFWGCPSIQPKNSQSFCDPFTKKLCNQCPRVVRVCKDRQADMSFTEGSLIRRVPTHTSLPLLNGSAGEMLAALEEAEVEHRGNYSFVKYHKIKLTCFHDFNYGFHNRILQTYQEILPSCFYEDFFCKWPFSCINYS